MAKNIATKVLLITGAGAQEFDSDEFNSAVEAVQSGAEISPEQQAIANALKAAPTQANVFNQEAGVTGGNQNTVAPVMAESPAPTTANAQSDVSKRVQGFLGGLGGDAGPSSSFAQGPSAGSTQQRIAAAGSPLGSTFDLASLQSQLVRPGSVSATNAANANANRQQTGNIATLGDQNLAEDVVNLQRKVEKDRLEIERQNQVLQDQVRRGVIPGAAKVRNRLGQPLVDLSAIGLTNAQTSRSSGISSLTPARGMPGGTLYNTRSTIIGR
jgi:hypothetical protein